tara:strand:+ start:18857 stop:20149 length:1293 start_codon:yes stop_codon:yes gene_type:complete
MKSCKFIENSLYIAPNEIRSCCQRFFFEGEIRGDAKLTDLHKGQSPSQIDIKLARKNMLDGIQNDEVKECKGCPHIYETTDKIEPTSKVKFLSIEQHSICNLRCTYCSPVYYGGVKSQYSVTEFIKSLKDKGNLDEIEGVVWGGGEPTIDKSFAEIMKTIEHKINKNIYHRIFTNSVRYNSVLQNYIDKDLVSITTSVDAGTRELYKKIRGRDKFFNTFENLNKYSRKKPNRVTVKYILTDENGEIEELKKFINYCEEYDLYNCCFQLSTNYKKEKANLESLLSIIYLFGELKKRGFHKIFLDDHISKRLVDISDEDLKKIKSFLSVNDIENTIIDQNLKDVIVYGSGEIVKNMINKTRFFKNLKNVYLIDNDKRKIGNYLTKYKIHSPEILKNNNNRILITSANHYEEIYSNIFSIQGTTKNIINSLII